LRGFDPEEAAMLACLVRFHKGSGPRPSYEPYAGLPDAAQRSVDWMTAMLHVADGLDRGRDQCVAETRANRSGGRVVITVDGPGDIGLACWAAEQKSSLLAGLMGVPVTLRPAPLPLAATATS
jgi:exopolyphosphatase/guanosine-5'-triphosphate,3'-diphosphate pyrophosphatase